MMNTPNSFLSTEIDNRNDKNEENNNKETIAETTPQPNVEQPQEQMTSIEAQETVTTSQSTVSADDTINHPTQQTDSEIKEASTLNETTPVAEQPFKPIESHPATVEETQTSNAFSPVVEQSQETSAAFQNTVSSYESESHTHQTRDDLETSFVTDKPLDSYSLAEKPPESSVVTQNTVNDTESQIDQTSDDHETSSATTDKFLDYYRSNEIEPLAKMDETAPLDQSLDRGELSDDKTFSSDSVKESQPIEQSNSVEDSTHFEKTEAVNTTLKHEEDVTKKQNEPFDIDSKVEDRDLLSDKPDKVTSYYEFDNQEKNNVNESSSVETENQEEKVEDDISINTAGHCLRQAREQKHLSLQFVADRLYLDVNVVKALEQDNYQGLPPPIFVRGYLRNYAKLVEISPETIMTYYDQREQHPSTPSLKPQSKQKKQTSSRDLWFTVLTAIIILTLMALMALWHFSATSSQPQEVVSFSNFATVEEEDPSLAIQSHEEEVASVGEENTVTLTTINQPSATETDMAFSETVEGTAITTLAPAPKPQKIVLQPKNTIWIKIIDNKNDKIYEGILQKGETKSFEGDFPFQVQVGNFGLDIKFQGETKNIKAFPLWRGRNKVFVVGNPN